MLTFCATLWIDSVVLILISTCVCSCFSQMAAGAWIGFAGAVAISTWKIIRAWRNHLQIEHPHGPCEWGLTFLVALVFVSMCVGPHCFLDSYSYRFPQMLFWIQEGHPWTVPNVDMRINQMPHVWPMLASAFYLPFGERGVALPNFISYLLLATLFRNWALEATSDGRRAGALALVFASAPVFLMGASTNDNVVTCTAFLALSLHFAILVSKSPDRISPSQKRLMEYSALSFALCCGIKPQYAVLAPIWAAWFFFAPVRPFRVFFSERNTGTDGRRSPAILRTTVLFFVLVLCSPAPTMAWNQMRCGSCKNPILTDCPETFSTPGPPEPIGRSFMSLGLQLFDSPINPFFAKNNEWIQTSDSGLAHAFRKYGIRFRPLQIAEGASFGFFVSFAFFIGLSSTLLRKKQTSTDNGTFYVPHKLLALAALVCLSLAICVTRAGTLGRSFIGFFVLLVPSAFAGFPHRIPTRFLSAYAFICFLSGVFVVVTDSARPLWPVESVVQRVNSPTLRKQLHDYAHYSRRQLGAKKLLESLPTDERTLGVIVAAGEPIAECWLGRKTPTKVIPHATNVTSERLDAESIRYLVVKTKNGEFIDPATGMLRDDFLCQIGCEIVARNSYTSYMFIGDEPWFLVRRNTH